MSPTPSLTTSTAFDLLRDEVDARLQKFHAAINDAAGKQAYDEVGKLAKAAQDVAALKQELAALEKRFGALVEAEPETIHADGKKFKKGLKTPESAYRRPILEALVELGGSSELHAVLDRVYAKMKPQLNGHDLAALPSDGVTPRWQNTAQWARNALREGGYLKDGSPHGVWEISEQGRAWLAEQAGPPKV
jgi:hypothetical protein